ncbi:hypothetical protein AAP_03868 [Ascosphaera apis ARSEF 7405]|uniref:Uncharacterized protein n=1 Tax=Ascosphaera apis ARSEF 7405 TaxID=392613 RepID=A0A167XQ84_9EURO|nr:hypothetical protein AAP_03868 [Ascosphaera apis ARSEF 7405]
MAVGMLGEDVALTLKEMGILEVEVEVEGVKDKIEGSEEGEKKIGTGHGVKRKRGSNVTIVSVDENNDHNCEEKEIGVVRKSAVLEFAKKHRIDLMDPVREEGFIGEVASEEDDEEEEGEDGSDEGSDNEELIEE